MKNIRIKKVKKMSNLEIKETYLYKTSEGIVTAEVYLSEDTIWATQKEIAKLFGVSIPTINEHLKNIFNDEELEKNSVIRKSLITAVDGKKYNTNLYNLDAIISVGYRVNSKKATYFRKWATQILKEYMIKGFALNDEALKNGGILGKDYFEELIIRIREIRLSEYRLYEKILEIYAQCSYDYNKDADITKEFFANVQNKLHYALTGQTAAELIKNRADHTKPHMGLNAWKSSPDGKIYSYDITVAKNYLSDEEIENLRILVDSFLNVAELRARNRIPTSMAEWAGLLEDFIKLNQYPILDGNGNISKRDADIHAKKEYELYRPIQDKLIKSEFEKLRERTQQRLK